MASLTTRRRRPRRVPCTFRSGWYGFVRVRVRVEGVFLLAVGVHRWLLRLLFPDPSRGETNLARGPRCERAMARVPSVSPLAEL